ncbi:hypothetical protein BDAP_001653 [Binucleata daphniae]
MFLASFLRCFKYGSKDEQVYVKSIDNVIANPKEIPLVSIKLLGSDDNIHGNLYPQNDKKTAENGKIKNGKQEIQARADIETANILVATEKDVQADKIQGNALDSIINQICMKSDNEIVKYICDYDLSMLYVTIHGAADNKIIPNPFSIDYKYITIDITKTYTDELTKNPIITTEIAEQICQGTKFEQKNKESEIFAKELAPISIEHNNQQYTADVLLVCYLKPTVTYPHIINEGKIKNKILIDRYPKYFTNQETKVYEALNITTIC